MDQKLQHPYPAVHTSQGFSVGGSQMWSENPIIRKCGCGPVAAYDLFSYLKRYHSAQPFYPARTTAEYCASIERIQKRYFPLLYPSGINGYLLALGINRLFHDSRLPWRAKWVSSGKKMFDRVSKMLSDDIPVILSVGPNFPFFWGGRTLPFYERNRIGALRRAAAVSGHYVTVLAINDEYMTVSSWGKLYEIRLDEYKAYVKSHSNPLFSNIVFIKKKG